MKLRFGFLGLATLTAAFANADHNWHLESTYTYSITGNVGQAVLRDVEKIMEGGTIDNSYSWGVSSSFDGGNSGTTTLSMDTYPFFGTSSAQPVLERSLLFGVMDAFPTDAAGQKHLVIFMDPLAAARTSGISFGTIFGTSVQGTPLTEEQIIFATEQVHREDLTEEQKTGYYEQLDLFRNGMAKHANVGVNGTEGSVWFAPGNFSIVTFSDGLTIGSGTNSSQATLQSVPEPASMAALGLGALALLKRRKKKTSLI